MSLSLELDKLKKAVLEIYNQKTGLSLSVDDVDIIHRRPYPYSIINFLITTKANGDYIRFAVAVRRFAKYTSFGQFQFGLFRNGGFGDLNDELQIMNADLGVDDYPFIKNFTESQEYASFVSNPPLVQSMSGKTILLACGLPLNTQR